MLFFSFFSFSGMVINHTEHKTVGRKGWGVALVGVNRRGKGKIAETWVGDCGGDSFGHNPLVYLQS